MSETVVPQAVPPAELGRWRRCVLFPEAGTAIRVYAVLDGASIPDLRDRLHELQPEHYCLYSGELEPDMAEVAPYLVLLEPDTPFVDYLLSQCWGNHWGVFAWSMADLKAMRRHFRTFLIVKDPDGQELYFRYYDPRVMRVYLPTCNRGDTAFVFGPVLQYLLEDEDPTRLLRFSPGQIPPKREVIECDPG